jgi:hypothetical protein
VAKRSEIAAARLKVTLAQARGDKVEDWIQELSLMNLDDADGIAVFEKTVEKTSNEIFDAEDIEKE